MKWTTDKPSKAGNYWFGFQYYGYESTKKEKVHEIAWVCDETNDYLEVLYEDEFYPLEYFIMHCFGHLGLVAGSERWSDQPIPEPEEA